jgi:CRP/FNR family transcriptional regulator, cyclic AMP receptor protein
VETEISEHSRARFECQLRGIGIPQAEVTELLRGHTLVNYGRDSTIFVAGTPADIIFAVVSGWVRVYYSIGDRRILCKLAGPGDVIGHMEVLREGGPGRRIFEARSLGKCSVSLVTREHLTSVLHHLDREVLIQILNRINGYWSVTIKRFVTMLLLSFRERLEFVLQELARDFGVRDARGILLLPELGHDDLADMIGSSRPMVTRLLGEMTEQGLVSRCGRNLVLLENRGLHAAA